MWLSRPPCQPLVFPSLVVGVIQVRPALGLSPLLPQGLGCSEDSVSSGGDLDDFCQHMSSLVETPQAALCPGLGAGQLGGLSVFL